MKYLKKNKKTTTPETVYRHILQKYNILPFIDHELIAILPDLLIHRL